MPRLPRTLSSAARRQLMHLRRRPDEKRATNALLQALHRDGLVKAEPLHRPSGKPSQYREWSITAEGLEELGEHHG